MEHSRFTITEVLHATWYRHRLHVLNDSMDYLNSFCAVYKESMHTKQICVLHQSFTYWHTRSHTFHEGIPIILLCCNDKVEA